jgi:hypothetical protein
MTGENQRLYAKKHKNAIVHNLTFFKNQGVAWGRREESALRYAQQHFYAQPHE